MARQPSSKGGVTKVRFIMLEAEGAEGDLAQIASAIQNALKPVPTIVQQRLPSAAGAPVMLSSEGEQDISDDESAVEVQLEGTQDAPKRSRQTKPRKPTTPDVLEFNFDSDVSLQVFASQYASVDNEPDRCLVIAAWFKECRDISAVTTSHIYTGYRKLNWSVAIEDFGWPLRHLKKQRLMASSSRGEFSINHLGLDKVKKLGRAE